MRYTLHGRTALLILLAAHSLVGPLAAADDVPALVATIRAVGREGAGNPAAARAWQSLSRLGPDALPAILAAFDDDNPVATNWIRCAADVVAERALREGKPLPAAALERFVLDGKNSSAGRHSAYQWLARADRTAPARLLPGFLHDRSPELRRDAVDARVESADAALARGDKAAAVAALREALSGACDKDQVDDVAKKLKGQGVDVDLAGHFGFIRSWYVVGPFDNSKGEKHTVAYPPEQGVDLSAAYTGKGGADCRWTPFATNDPYGKVDLNKAVGKKKGVLAYARAVVESPGERRAEIRLSTATALKVFHNGKEVLSCEEYYHGIPEMDQFIVPVVLKAGRNEVMVKVCQNEETGSWAEPWWFQARLCDATGAAVPFTVASGPAARPADAR